MKAIAGLAAGAAVFLASCATSPSQSVNREQELANVTAGRVAGQPVDCINQQRISSSRIIDGLAIVYTMSDGTIYVNRPTSGASFLESNAILITDTHSNQLCSIDIVRLQDSGSQTQIGSVGLTKFVPYPRTNKPA